jgi:hypothetical protein
MESGGQCHDTGLSAAERAEELPPVNQISWHGTFSKVIFVKYPLQE